VTKLFFWGFCVFGVGGWFGWGGGKIRCQASWNAGAWLAGVEDRSPFPKENGGRHDPAVIDMKEHDDLQEAVWLGGEAMLFKGQIRVPSECRSVGVWVLNSDKNTERKGKQENLTNRAKAHERGHSQRVSV